MIYDLYGVANHMGGMGGGHYFAYCRNLDGTWYNYNDSNIHLYCNPTDERYKDRQVATSAAYCLFYRRRDS
jgi:ubiquitin carboxyl-terminal hydrolase 4/11/15